MEIIDKSTFNKLNIKEQVNVFNALLRKHRNIKGVCKIINISYSTIRDRFTKGNYIFNKFSNQYEITDLYEENSSELEKKIEEVINKLDKKESNPLHEFNKFNQDSNVVIRSFRVHENVLDDFVKYCENTNLKQYDVISLFIHEGLRKYS
ncbi:MAG: hypothetical protein ACRCX8_07260 [Sarcina sp.]